MLNQGITLAEHGLAIHWLHEKAKNPVSAGWSEKPFPTIEELRKTHKKGYNLGFRPGALSKVDDNVWVIVIDCDVRDPAQKDDAFLTLRNAFPKIDFTSAPSVVSGSGGESRHFYVFTSDPHVNGVVAHSEGSTMVEDKTRGKRVKKNDWEIQVLGTGANCVLPPSIHPESGNPYVWEREIDWTDVALDLYPVLSKSDWDFALNRDGENTSVVIGAQEPMGLTPEEIEETLSEYPNFDLHYDDFIQVVGAVAFEAEGKSKEEKQKYLDVLIRWSAQSSGKHDPKETEKKFWKGFRNKADRSLKTMRTYVSIAKLARLDRMVDDFDDMGEVADNSDDDLLGEISETPKKTRKPLKWEDEEAPQWVKKMNKKYALIVVGGKSNIMRFKQNHKGEEEHDLWDLKTFHDWHQALGTISVPSGGGKKKDVTMSTAFLSNEYRRGYDDGYVFDTTMTNTKGFNLFVGWGVEPKKGNCNRILKHVRDILCRGDEEAYEYFLDYFAHLFQKPHEIPRAAIVVKGEEGAGKDTWAAYLMPALRRYVPKITGQDQFFGNFNGFLKNAIFVNLQESFVGSAQNNEKMKQFISDDVIKVENKYQNAYDTPNFMRLYITSNNFRVIAASESDRRHLALRASSDYVAKGDRASANASKAYFDAIYKERDNGGAEALVYYLLNRKLTNFPRIPPATDELSTQIASNWKGLKKFIYRCALEGSFHPGANDNERFKQMWMKDGVKVEKAEFRDQFNLWCRDQSKRDLDDMEPSAQMIGKLLNQMAGAVSSKGRYEGGLRNIYKFRDLKWCRDQMSKFARGKLTWEEDDEAEEEIVEEEDDL